jgi:hypothetical protein
VVRVAERAVLARSRNDGRYDLAAARWGGTDRALGRVCAGTAPGSLPGVSWQDGPTLGFVRLRRSLDYLSTAALYRVRPAGTTAFLPLWFGLGLPSARPSATIGALVAVASLPDARRLRSQFRALKGRLVDALASGTLPATAAPGVLVAAVAGLEARERYLSGPPLSPPSGAAADGSYP